MSVSRKVTASRHRRKLLRHRYFQSVVLRDDRGLEPAKVRSGVDAQLVGEQRPCTLKCAQRFTLPAGAVKGEHELAPTPLAQWRIGDRRLEFADDLRGTTRREQRVGPVLHQGGMALDPACLLGDPARATGQFGDAAPESQRLVEAGHSLAGVPGGDGVAGHLGGQLITRGIDLGRGQGPARALRQHEAVAQGAT